VDLNTYLLAHPPEDEELEHSSGKPYYIAHFTYNSGVLVDSVRDIHTVDKEDVPRGELGCCVVAGASLTACTGVPVAALVCSALFDILGGMCVQLAALACRQILSRRCKPTNALSELQLYGSSTSANTWTRRPQGTCSLHPRARSTIWCAS